MHVFARGGGQFDLLWCKCTELFTGGQSLLLGNKATQVFARGGGNFELPWCKCECVVHRAREIGFGSSQGYACICQRRPSDDSETKTRDSETKTRESETKTDESETKARESQTKAEY